MKHSTISTREWFLIGQALYEWAKFEQTRPPNEQRSSDCNDVLELLERDFSDIVKMKQIEADGKTGKIELSD